MDLTFQVPMQYVLCSIRFYFHHQTFPCLSIVSALAQPFILGLLVILLQSSTVAYWTPGGLIFGPFIQLMKFSQQIYWDGLPFPPPVDPSLITNQNTSSKMHCVTGFSDKSQGLWLEKPVGEHRASLRSRIKITPGGTERGDWWVDRQIHR